MRQPNTNGNADSYGNTDSNGNAYCDSNSHGNGNSHGNCAAEVFAHATATADTAAAPGQLLFG